GTCRPREPIRAETTGNAMHIEVQCKGCQARYRLKEELAGRMARCKHCGTQFRVPYRTRVVGLDEEDRLAQEQTDAGATVAGPSPAAMPERAARAPREQKEQRTFEEYGLAAREDEEQTTRDDAVKPILPPIIADLWMPLGLVVVCYGISLYMALDRMIHSTGPLAGILLIGVMVVMYLALIIPMVMRTLEGASKTVEFELPNAVWLQTAAALGLPTLSGTIGFFAAGAGGAVAGVFLRLTLMMPAMLLMYGIEVMKAVHAAVLAALFYAMTLGGSVLVLVGIGLLVFPLWHMNVPWREPEATPVATATPTPTPAAPTTQAAPP